MHKVAVLMGSKSDMQVMQPAADVLIQKFGIESEIHVISAHRTPHKVAEFASNAAANGFDVIIAGAGMAAHLAGVLAAFTPLPVIGVPIKSASFEGMDALLSMVQMPSGVPVATVAVNGAKNAGILAAQIIGVGDPEVRKKIEDYKRTLAEAK
ncbi:MAG: 5-(carboxyamino)imidazole ribonucleotide mutase [Armatimonadota bacterium]